MALYYLETSALAKLYVRELGTDKLLSLASRSADHRFAISALAPIEFRSAIRRREKSGEIPPNVATNLLDSFNLHLEGRFVIQKLTDFVLDIAGVLVDGYVLRAFDAIQLAAYLALKASAGPDVPTFVCSDRELLSAARQEGLPILDPSSADGV